MLCFFCLVTTFTLRTYCNSLNVNGISVCCHMSINFLYSISPHMQLQSPYKKTWKTLFLSLIIRGYFYKCSVNSLSNNTTDQWSDHGLMWATAAWCWVVFTKSKFCFNFCFFVNTLPITTPLHEWQDWSWHSNTWLVLIDVWCSLFTVWLACRFFPVWLLCSF